LRQGQSLTTPVQCLVWIAKQPQGQRFKRIARYAGVLPKKCGTGAMLLSIIEHEPLRTLLAAGHKVSQVVQTNPYAKASFQQQRRIVEALRHDEEPLPKLMGGLVGRPHLIKFPKSYENRKKLWGLSQVLTELPGAAVDTLHVCRRIALGGNHDWPKREEQPELPLRTLGSVQLCLEQIQRACQVAQRLPMGMALDRGLRCTLQILHGPMVVAPVCKVHRQFGRGLACTWAKGLL